MLRDEKGEEVSSGPAETGLGLPGFLSAGFPDDQPHTDTCTVKSAKYKTAYEMEMSAQYGMVYTFMLYINCLLLLLGLYKQLVYIPVFYHRL